VNTERLKGWLSSSSKLVAASAQLAKKQTELATLNNVTLPKLYHAIGKRIINAKNLPPDLLPHRERIRELEAAIAAKPEEPKSEPASGFAAKAKQMAQLAASKTAKATADAAASMKIQAAYVALGRQAIDKYGQNPLPQELREQYEAAMQKQAALADEIRTLKSASGKGFVTPGRLALFGVAACVLLGLWTLRGATGWLFERSKAPTIGVVVSGDEQSSHDQLRHGDPPADEPANPQGESPLRSLVRVPRGKDRDPGWSIQTLHRLFKSDDGIERNSDLGRLLYAYRSGFGVWQSNNELIDSLENYGLPATNWKSQAAIPFWQGKGSDLSPFVQVNKEDDGTRVILAPIEITDDLLCSISFLVIDNSRSARAAGLDFLATQVELYGGKKFDLGTSSVIRADTIVDFWSSTNMERYTVSRWLSDGIGHRTVQTYAPLLFTVLNNDPDFMFIENLKIALSPRFRKGCRELCDKVMELRKAQGQESTPVCRKP
jgi:hypothetical protein